MKVNGGACTFEIEEYAHMNDLVAFIEDEGQWVPYNKMNNPKDIIYIKLRGKHFSAQ